MMKSNTRIQYALCYYGIFPFVISFFLILSLSGCAGSPAGEDTTSLQMPSNLQTQVVDAHQVSLSWIDNASSETGFKIERRTDGGSYSELVSPIPANTTTYTDSGLSAATSYYYRVRAYDAHGFSEYSNEAGVTTVSLPVSRWPDETNTGVLSVYDAALGRNLQYSDLIATGSLRIDADWVAVHGSRVVEKLDVTGNIIVLENNITIRRCRVRATSESCAILINWGYAGLAGSVIEDVEIENTVGAAVAITDGVVRRCNMHTLGSDGVFIGTNSILEDCYIHDLFQAPGSHNDGIQTLGGSHMIVRRNRVENPLTQTSCILLEHYSTNLNDILIESNLFNGGGYTVYGGEGLTNEYTNSSIRFINNRFGRKFYPNGGYWGPLAYYAPEGPGNQWSGNVWDDTGLPLNP